MKHRHPNEPDDIRQYDNDPRSPYYQEPKVECAKCHQWSDQDIAIESPFEDCFFCSEECIKAYYECSTCGKDSITECVCGFHEGRGGARKGAGRKALPKDLKRVNVTLRLPQWMLDELDKRDQSRGRLIEKAILNTYRMKAPVQKEEGKTKGRKKITGRFETREELEEAVWNLWANTKCNQAAIARNCRVSPTTVANILNRPGKHPE